MSEALPSVAVVIPTQARAELLAQTIGRLLDDPGVSELIVVQDGHDPATAQLLDRTSDARLRRLHVPAEDPRERGRGQLGRDVGVEAARSEVVLTLDDDVVPDAGLASGHARVHARHPDAVVVGYTPVALEGQPWRLRPAARFYARSYETVCASYASDPGQVLLSLWGGQVSVPRQGWTRAAGRAVGGAGYHGDRELGLRLRAAGLHGRFEPGLRATHHYRRTLRELQADAASSAAGHAQLHEAHPALVDARAPSRHAPVRALERVAAGESGRRAVTAALRGTALAGAALRAAPVELAAARLLFRVAARG